MKVLIVLSLMVLAAVADEGALAATDDMITSKRTNS